MYFFLLECFKGMKKISLLIIDLISYFVCTWYLVFISHNRWPKFTLTQKYNYYFQIVTRICNFMFSFLYVCHFCKSEKRAKLTRPSGMESNKNHFIELNCQFTEDEQTRRTSGVEIGVQK